MADTENKYVKKITDIAKKAIIANSVQSLEARPTSSATEMKKKFVTPIVNMGEESDGPCLANEVDRVAQEANDAIVGLNTPIICGTLSQYLQYTLKEVVNGWKNPLDIGEEELSKDASVGDFIYYTGATKDGVPLFAIFEVVSIDSDRRVVRVSTKNYVKLTDDNAVNALSNRITAAEEAMPYVADFNFPLLYATYEELKNNPVLNFEGIVRKHAEVGDHFGTLAMTTDDRTVWVSLIVTEVREEDGYLLKAKVTYFCDYVDGKLVKDINALNSAIATAKEAIDTLEEDIPLVVINENNPLMPSYGGNTYANWLASIGDNNKYVFLQKQYFNRTPKPGDIFTHVVKTSDDYVCKVFLKVANGSFTDGHNSGAGLTTYVITLYSPEELNAIKSKLDSFSLYEIVSSLPASGDANKLYLKPSSGQEEGNILEEWLWVNDKWEMVGTKKVEIDLTPYAKKDEVISLSQKGAANGVASLDATGKVPVEQLPDDIGGGIDEEALKDYVKFTDYATGTKAGVAKFLSTRGIAVSNEGNTYIVAANKTQIEQKGTPYTPITPTVLDYAVKVGITTNTEEWTDDDKAAACETIGAVAKRTDKTGNKWAYVKNEDGTQGVLNVVNKKGDASTGLPSLKYADDNFSAIYLHEFTTSGFHMAFYSTQKEKFIVQDTMPDGSTAYVFEPNYKIFNAKSSGNLILNMHREYTDLLITYLEAGAFQTFSYDVSFTSLDDASYTVTKL